MEDAAIVDLYWARDEQALAETAAKFGAYCRKIADNILHSAHDAEECENDTWLAAWNSMPTNRLRGWLRIWGASRGISRWTALTGGGAEARQRADLCAAGRAGRMRRRAGQRGGQL